MNARISRTFRYFLLFKKEAKLNRSFVIMHFFRGKYAHTHVRRKMDIGQYGHQEQHKQKSQLCHTPVNPFLLWYRNAIEIVFNVVILWSP